MWKVITISHLSNAFKLSYYFSGVFSFVLSWCLTLKLIWVRIKSLLIPMVGRVDGNILASILVCNTGLSLSPMWTNFEEKRIWELVVKGFERNLQVRADHYKGGMRTLIESMLLILAIILYLCFLFLVQLRIDLKRSKGVSHCLIWVSV